MKKTRLIVLVALVVIAASLITSCGSANGVAKYFDLEAEYRSATVLKTAQELIGLSGYEIPTTPGIVPVSYPSDLVVLEKTDESSRTSYIVYNIKENRIVLQNISDYSDLASTTVVDVSTGRVTGEIGRAHV